MKTVNVKKQQKLVGGAKRSGIIVTKRNINTLTKRLCKSIFRTASFFS